MKTRTSLLPALLSGLVLTVASSHAETYSGTLPGTGNWSNVVWSPESPAPGENDDILDISAASTLSLYLDAANRSFKSFGKTSDGNIRISAGSNTTSFDSTLDIEGALTLTDGTYLFRGHESGGRLTVNVENLFVGSLATASVRIADAPAYENVTFTVSGTTVLTGSASVIYVGTDADDTPGTQASLGHVIFRDTVNATGSIGINLGVETEIKSLRTEGVVSTVATVGGDGGTLLLTGMADDPLQPTGDNRWEGHLTGTIRLRKTGDNTQILARGRGTSYTGGTEVEGGILAVTNQRNNESALGTGAVTIGDHGTLAAEGTGTVRLGADQTVTVESGGTLAPGALGKAGFDRLAFNGSANGTAPILTMEAGAAFTFELGEDGLSDQIFFTGYSGAEDLVLNNNLVNLTGTITEGVYHLLVFKSNETPTSNLDSLTSIASGLTGGLLTGSGFDGFTATFHYDDVLFGGPGVIALELTAVPEPATVVPALLVGGAWLVARRHKQG